MDEIIKTPPTEKELAWALEFIKENPLLNIEQVKDLFADTEDAHRRREVLSVTILSLRVFKMGTDCVKRNFETQPQKEN